MNNAIISTIIITIVISVVLALILGFSSVLLAVKADERIEKVYEALPHFNCGACGYPGCMGMAEGLIKSEVAISNCRPSKPDQRIEISKILEELGIEYKLEK